MIYLASAFALSMLPGDCRMTADKLEPESVSYYLRNHDYTSVVGHASTAAYMQQKLNIPVGTNRAEIKMSYGDSVYVCQVGVRLQEGQVLTKEELDNIPVSFWVVTIMRPV